MPNTPMPPNIKGIDAAITLLRALQDPKETQKRLQPFLDYMEKVTELYDQGQGIEKAYQSAELYERKAKDLVDRAEERMKTATEYKQKVAEEAKTNALRFEQEKKNITTAQAELRQQKAALDASEQALAEQWSQLNKDKDQAQADRSYIQKELVKLKEDQSKLKQAYDSLKK